MYGILSKKLFISNSKYLSQSFSKNNKIKNLLTSTRFLRNNTEKNENFKSQAIRNYANLNIKQCQQNSNNILPPIETTAQLSIFMRFKEAYKKHGKVIVFIHLGLCVVWVYGFYILSKSGFDIQNLFTLLEKIRLISHETTNSIVIKIETFDLEKFLRNNHFNQVLSDSKLDYIGKLITGVTLKHWITAIMLYKIFTPLRYLATLTVSKVAIDKLIKHNYIQRPPPGSSLKEMTQETTKNIVTNGRKLKKIKSKIYSNYKSKLNKQKSNNENQNSANKKIK